MGLYIYELTHNLSLSFSFTSFLLFRSSLSKTICLFSSLNIFQLFFQPVAVSVQRDMCSTAVLADQQNLHGSAFCGRFMWSRRLTKSDG